MSNRILTTFRGIVSTKLTVVIAMALFAAIALTVSAAQTAPRAQAELLRMAEQKPETAVRVIVQKQGSTSNVEASIAKLGGRVTGDLSMIHAFSAELSAKDVAQLARSEGVRWVSLDAPVVKTDCASCINTSSLASAYIRTIGADQLWNESPSYLQGQGIGVAVVDTGISKKTDFNDASGLNSRVTVSQSFIAANNSSNDNYGHGTHVAGIIGGNGARSNGVYIGVAPNVNLLNLKVSDRNGVAYSSDVVSALQWIYNNKSAYNIRVVNLSFNSSTAESYLTNPIDAAVEILWFNGITVVTAAGNNGTNSNSGVLYPPANDPFVITVGATNDMGTADRSDDVVAPYSSYGTTLAGFVKPELVAPGTNIISVVANAAEQLAQDHPDHLVLVNGNYYFRMSGTSMAAAVTSGAAALLIQSNPSLTPDQIKYRLMATARPVNGAGAGAGELDAYGAVHGTSTNSANTGIQANQLLWTGSNPITWNSVNWNSVNWNSVNWNSVNWNSVNWNSVNWNSVNWNSVNWNSVWDQ